MQRLSLTLFMPGIHADHVDTAAPSDDFAIFANPAYTCSDLHCCNPLFLNNDNVILGTLPYTLGHFTLSLIPCKGHLAKKTYPSVCKNLVAKRFFVITLIFFAPFAQPFAYFAVRCFFQPQRTQRNTQRTQRKGKIPTKLGHTPYPLYDTCLSPSVLRHPVLMGIISRMQIILDGQSVSAKSGETILDVAAREGIDIPTLCYLPEIKLPSTSCLVCLVKLDGRFVPSCAVRVEDGMVIESETEEVHSMRRSALELLLSDHISHCRTCGEGRKKCRLLKLMAKYRGNRQRFGSPERAEDATTTNLLQGGRVVFDSRKCIKCGICIALARKYGEPIGLTFLGRGFETSMGIPFDEPLQKAVERSAEQIVPACPTAALVWRE